MTLTQRGHFPIALAIAQMKAATTSSNGTVMIDPSQKFVYLGKGPVPWWRTGTPVPANNPRDIRWNLRAYDEGLSQLVLTLDLRTLVLYARFSRLEPETEMLLER